MAKAALNMMTRTCSEELAAARYVICHPSPYVHASDAHELGGGARGEHLHELGRRRLRLTLPLPLPLTPTLATPTPTPKPYLP